MNRLALGTVQFGLPYGIANQSGQVTFEEAGRILTLARKGGIDTLDTAIAYGCSEACLGLLGTRDFKVVTKLPAMPDGVADVGLWVDAQVQNSLVRMNVGSIFGLLLHRSEQLMGPRGREMAHSLERLKDKGIVQKVGVSIYDSHELDYVMSVWAIDLVQAPFNLMDRRLITSGWLERLNEKDVEVHTRSTFLQGLLLMPRNAIPDKFSPWFDLFDYWHAWLQENSISAIEACLAFVEAQPLIDRIVVGVDNCVQLQQLLRASVKETPTLLPDLQCDDERLINPSNWISL